MPHLLTQQLNLDTALDKFREILSVTLSHLSWRDFFTDNLTADVVQQQTRSNETICRILFDQRTRRQDGALAYLFDRHAVIKILQGHFEYLARINSRTQTFACRFDAPSQNSHIERTQHFAVFHIQSVFNHIHFDLGTLLHPFFTIQNVRTRDIVLARAHQRQFDLILDVFDMEGAAMRLATH
jgi:hypothetical protein